MTTPDSTPLAFTEHYSVERELGRGGMAVVYLARDLRHDREVALKVLDSRVAPAGAERFLCEIRIAARLTHPHVLGVHDSGESGGQLFYVMPYVDGETLRARLAREGALPIADALRLFRELADALEYAHARGVVHRDLKPENVLLSGGHAVVADFGIAKAVAAATQQDTSAREGLTATGVVLGTPAYMAPEQAVGDATMDHRADLYALGLIAYEMLSGRHPFAGRTAQAIAAAHLVETPVPLAERRAGVPPVAASLVQRLLAKDPAARPQSAAEVVRVLDGLSAAPGRAAARAPRVTTLLLPALLIVAALAAYALWRRGARAREAPGIHTIAVLPFANSGSADDEYFSDGLTDELANALSRVPGLRIAGRTSSYAYKGKSARAEDIGRALDVAALVDGSVRRAGDHLRVVTQLVSTSDGKVLWDSVYDSRSTDVFSVQDEFTRAIVAAVAPSLGAAVTRPAVDVKRGTADEAAYELYLKGHYYWLQRGVANLERSAAYYRQAIARDSTFARAWAGLALAYGVLPSFAPDPGDSLSRLARTYADRAVALDSTLGDAQVALGLANDADPDIRFSDGLAHYRKATVLDPSSAPAHHLLALSLLNLGRTDEAITELRRAMEADPLMRSPASAYSSALLFARQFPAAISAAHRMLALDSGFVFGIWTLGFAQALGGQADSAVATLERGTRIHPDDPRLFGALALAYAVSGRWADAQRIREQLHRPGADQIDGVQAAFTDLVFGDREPLVRILTSNAGIHRFVSAGGILGCNPEIDPLWPDERFRARMDELGIERCALARPWPIRPPARPR